MTKALSKEDTLKEVSRFLADVLRHHPERVGVKLDREGWANLSFIISRSPPYVSFGNILAASLPQGESPRFDLDISGNRIRAFSGHTVAVQEDNPVTKPPLILLHGTTAAALPAILKEGLKPSGRKYVHLTSHPTVAHSVALRHPGEPVTLCIDCESMDEQGYAFRHTESDIWLVESVPPEFITVPGSNP